MAVQPTDLLQVLFVGPANVSLLSPYATNAPVQCIQSHREYVEERVNDKIERIDVASKSDMLFDLDPHADYFLPSPHAMQHVLIKDCGVDHTSAGGSAPEFNPYLSMTCDSQVIEEKQKASKNNESIERPNDLMHGLATTRATTTNEIKGMPGNSNNSTGSGKSFLQALQNSKSVSNAAFFDTPISQLPNHVSKGMF